MNISRRLQERSLRPDPQTQHYASEHFVRNLDISRELQGHQGCVNALNWSADGKYLASGSDDTNVIIWNASSVGFDKVKVIHTGHTRNIFSVMFAPGTNNRTIVSAAGDCQIRIFDVEYGSGTVVMESPCARTVHKCHRDRVKRIAMEADGHTFLSCAEDGDIRQFDLRDDNSSNRPPLVSYGRQQIDLNTITLNKLNPYLFATGGSHPCAFLHDRRMVGRDLKTEWGQVPTSSSEATNCVRKYRSPKSRRGHFRGEHLTALQFGQENSRELLGSWSADDVHLFDIHGQTDRNLGYFWYRSKSPNRCRPDTGTKRKRSSTTDNTVDNLGELANLEDLEFFDRFMAIRKFLLCPPFHGRNYAKAHDHVFATLPPIEKLSPSHFLAEFKEEYLTHYELHLGFLNALARKSRMTPWETRQTNMDWFTTTSQVIVDTFCRKFEELSVANRIAAPVAGYDAESILRAPMIDYTNPEHTLFKDCEALATAFNALLDDEASFTQLNSPTGCRFWLERVCRSLLASSIIEASVGDYAGAAARPEEPTTDNPVNFDYADSDWDDIEDNDFNDEYDNNDDDDDDDDSCSDTDEMDTDPRNDEAAEMERARQSYEHDINTAVESVNPGVPIVMPFRSFSGHVNVETVKDVNFFGQADEYVVSGSDDGLLFVWDKKTSKIVTILRADDSVTNVIQGHPSTMLMAASGIDDTIKIFEPMEEAARESRRVHESEYTIRARNERRAAAGEEERFGGGVRISRRMLMNLQQFDHDLAPAECRQQ